jgi:hypothetical protein
MRRSLALLVSLAALLCLAWAPAAHADGGSSPQLSAMLRIADLNASIRSANDRLATLTLGLDQSATRLQRAADRVARIRSRLAWQSTVAAGSGSDHPRRLSVGGSSEHSALSAALAALASAQRAVRSHAWLPRLVRAQRRIDLLSAERQRELTLAAGSSIGPLVPAGVGSGREAWAVDLLNTLGAPACSQNLVAVVAWQSAESTDAGWNPLATTMPADGATAFNSAGVKQYATRQAGLAATVDTLRAGYATQGYGWILYRLSQCAPAEVTAEAINASNWCRGCAGGAYVTGLLPAVEADYRTYAGG